MLVQSARFIRRRMVDEADTLTFQHHREPLSIRTDEPAALYVHIPFCRYLCPFCPYNKVAYDPAAADSYFVALRQEIHHAHERCGRLAAGSLYFGGGTPTVAVGGLAGVMDEIHAAFALQQPAAIETTPAALDHGLAATLRQLGFGLVSLGVQSYQDRLLRQIGRPYDGAAARRASAILCNAGFETVNFDLMFAVPGQSLAELQADLLEAISYGPEQITCYPLFTFPYTRVRRWLATKRVGVPRERLRWQMYRLICEVLADHGYERASVWSFIRKGRRAFSSVTRDRYLGFGAGAASYNGRMFSFNTFSVAAYQAAVDNGEAPTAIGMAVSKRLEQMFWLYWRLYETRVPKAAYRQLFAREIEMDFRWILRCLRGLGFVETETNDELTLNTRGCHWVHQVQNLLALNDVNTVWSAAQATAFPDRIRL